MIPVVFDLDGTLIDSLPDITKAVNALLADHGQPGLPPETVSGFVGMGVEVLMERMIAATDFEPGDAERLMPPFIHHYKSATASTRLFPGVREAIDALRADGVPLALCTNKPSAPLGPTLEAGGLKDAFEVVVAGDTLPVRKPDPGPVQHILATLGARTCVYVGDSETDAETARAAGVPFAFFTEGIRQKPASEIPHDALFSNFSDLRAVYRDLTKNL